MVRVDGTRQFGPLHESSLAEKTGADTMRSFRRREETRSR